MVRERGSYRHQQGSPMPLCSTANHRNDTRNRTIHLLLPPSPPPDSSVSRQNHGNCGGMHSDMRKKTKASSWESLMLHRCWGSCTHHLPLPFRIRSGNEGWLSRPYQSITSGVLLVSCLSSCHVMKKRRNLVGRGKPPVCGRRSHGQQTFIMETIDDDNSHKERGGVYSTISQI